MTTKLEIIKTNFYKVHLGNLTIWFSYSTPIAFDTGRVRAVRSNAWEATTGKHLNLIDDGARRDRISGDEFESRLQQVIPHL